MGKKILVVDDEVKILNMIKTYLEKEGFIVFSAEDGKTALELFKKHEPDLMVLDLMLPEMDGFDICKSVRRHSDVPIIMLTAKTEEIDKLLGLELGADDYITKPFSLRELTARIKAILRRVNPGKTKEREIIKRGELIIDPVDHKVKVNNRDISLTPTEFKILHLLAEHPGRVFSRLQILESVFGEIYEGYERSIDTHISNLRKKIEDDPNNPIYIKTLYGVGYRFEKMEESAK